MKRLLKLVLIGLLLLAALVISQPVGAGTSYEDVANELMCQCGCRLTLTACNMPECSVRKKMTDQVNTMLQQGQSKDQIIQYFVGTYGEEALAAPTKQGFNLTAWLMPFAAVAVGLGFVYLIVDKWVLGRGPRAEEEDAAVVEDLAPTELSRYERRLKKELDDDQDEGGA